MRHAPVNVEDTQENEMHTRDMRFEMMRMLSATAAFASGIGLGVGALIVGVIALLQ